LVHFNWVVGHEKISKMMHYNKWFKKVKICQHGVDGFGHKFEGMLRLLSLDINNKADYQYNFKTAFEFQHSNFDIEILQQYLFESLKILSNEKCERLNSGTLVDDFKTTSDNVYQLSYKEERTFDDILIHDISYQNTIYLYDGVTCSISEKLPPNFETNNEIENSLPLLRKAFVEKNNILPKPSYDNKLINVCCHIRMGDAIGQRILDNKKIYQVINVFQKNNNYRIIIHSDGDVSKMMGNNTILYDSKTDVLQVLSDFISADILIINYSSLSIAAHLLADKNQSVICPTNAGQSFKPRILDKCITCDDFLQIYAF